MGAISELYRGRISAPTDIRVRTAEYDRLIDEAEKLTEALQEKLDSGTAKKLEELLDTQHMLTAIASEDSYTRGFRDGAGIMLDVLNVKNE